MRFAKSDGCAVAIMLGLIFNIMPLTPVAAEDPYKAQIDALRKAMEKYKDYKVAVRTFTFRPSAACATPVRKWLATCIIPRARWVFTL